MIWLSKPFLTIFLVALIFCCIKRQLRYWRELQMNRPSRSIRVGYSLATISVFVTLAYTFQSSDDGAWPLFVSFLGMVVFFCLKITFSPAVLGLILSVCTFEFVQNNEFPLFEVWSSFTSIVTWRFSEGVRAAYTAISFIWIVAAFFSPGAATVSDVASGVEVASDSTAGIDAATNFLA